MGRGIGRSLFQHAVEGLRESGGHVLKIGSDPNAEGFYQRLGAKRVGNKRQRIEGSASSVAHFGL